jgi:3-phenylpropionate/cinnamic acid dioxygenase small subunit
MGTGHGRAGSQGGGQADQSERRYRRAESGSSPLKHQQPQHEQKITNPTANHQNKSRCGVQVNFEIDDKKRVFTIG